MNTLLWNIILFILIILNLRVLDTFCVLIVYVLRASTCG